MSEIKVDDTSWESLFWSLMAVIEDNDELMDVFEVFEIAGLQIDAEENDDK